MIRIDRLDDGARPMFETEAPPARNNPYHLSAEPMRNGTLRYFSSLVARTMQCEGIGRRAASQRVAKTHPSTYRSALKALSR